MKSSSTDEIKKKAWDFYNSFRDIYQKTCGNHQPVNFGVGRNGLPPPKIWRACINFAQSNISLDEFKLKAGLVLRGAYYVTPPGDIAELWAIWNRLIPAALKKQTKPSGCSSAGGVPVGLSYNADPELPRETGRRLSSQEPVSIGRVLGGVIEQIKKEQGGGKK